jgi:hypothetical protein
MGVFDQQLVQSVGRHVGFGGQDFGCRRCRSHSENMAVVESEIQSCFGQHGGLPRTGGSDDQLQWAIPSNRSHCLLLARRQMLAEMDLPRPGCLAFGAVLNPGK